MDFDPLQLFMAILRYVPAIIVIVIATVFIFSFKVTIVTDEMQRTNIQMAEALMASSEITSSRAVFDPVKLDKMIKDANSVFHPDGKEEKQPNIENEKIARNCRLAYKAEIIDLTSDKKWGFGYTPGSGGLIEGHEVSASYDVSLFDQDKGARPAKLTVILRESWLSKIGCMIEDAYGFKEKITLDLPSCLYEEKASTPAGTKGAATSTYCGFLVKKEYNGYHICLSKQKGGFTDSPPNTPEEIECRYFPEKINIINSPWLYEYDGKKHVLTVYPLKYVPVGDAKSICKDINQGAIPGNNEEVKSVILCIE